jgi:PKD repeat protein
MKKTVLFIAGCLLAFIATSPAWAWTPNRLPLASFIAGPIGGPAPLNVKLDASESYDPDGTITRYLWDFGDGATGSGVSQSHSYAQAGTYGIRLTVIDNRGARKAATVSVTVTPAVDPDTPTDPGVPGGLSGVPAGIYSIDTVVDKPFVDGVLIRVYWSQVEKTEGQYDFSKAAAVIKQAQALGQSVSIANMVVAEPGWLLNKTETFSDPQFGMITAPWDETMLAALEKYITAFSNYQVDGIALKDHPTVRQIDASIGGIQSIRMMQPPSGYTAQKLEDGVLRSVRAWAAAFPNKHLYAGLFGINDGAKTPSTVERIRDDLMAEFDGVNKPRLNFFQEVLTGAAPSLNSPLATVVSDVKSRTSILYQACGEWKNKTAWSWCYWADNDTPDIGIGFGYNNFNTTYFEIYQADLMNEAYASQFQKWHDILSPYNQ